MKGFGLEVTYRGYRTFIVQKKVHGRLMRRKIGRMGDDGYLPHEAREVAEKYIRWMERGLDPKEVEEAGRQLTLRALVEDYIANRRKKNGDPLADKTKDDIRKHLERNWSQWADLPVTAITRSSVKAQYLRIAERGETQANNSMRLLRPILNYSMDLNRDEEDNPIPASNPVDVIRRNQFPDRSREDRVPSAKLGLFYSEVRNTRLDALASWSTRIKAAAVEMILITGLRTRDVISRRWEEVDIDHLTLWTEGKSREWRLFPLATQAGDVLQWLWEHSENDHLFPSAGGKKYPHVGDIRAGLKRANSAIGGHHIKPHDLRRNHADLQTELGIDLLIGEMLSNRFGTETRAIATRIKHYASYDLTCYRRQAQAIGTHYEKLRKKAEKKRRKT